MTPGGTSPGLQRGRVPRRSRSLRPPSRPASQEPLTPRDAPSNPPAATSRFGRAVQWPGWVKLAAMATIVGTLGASGAAIGALWFTGQSLRATNSQIGLAQQTAVTDRFRLATQQLASDNLSVRISGIYLLERLANDSPADHPTVYAVLAAFVRTQSGLHLCGILPHPEPNLIEPRADVQTALTIIGRRDLAHDSIARRLDLRRTCLLGADLVGADLVIVDLANADLTNAQLTVADISNANLTAAGLRHADLRHANLLHAHLDGANLTNANLAEANLTNTRLARADLTGADLRHADLTGADLTDTVLTGVVYDNATQWPSGFTPPPR